MMKGGLRNSDPIHPRDLNRRTVEIGDGVDVEGDHRLALVGIIEGILDLQPTVAVQFVQHLHSLKILAITH